MPNKLQSYFPMIRTKKEILQEIHNSHPLSMLFSGWSAEEQSQFLDFCCGNKGLKILYDPFFKEIMNPESVPERLEQLLSLILKQEVHILRVLPNDSVRLADEVSLLVTDIVVELENGTIANVEIQKIGYNFPGQRCACYSSDLLLRQYKRIRSEKKKKFVYKDIQDVYTIVFFETSPADFHAFSDTYLHRFQQLSDTGLEMDLLQKYFFIPLDIFRQNLHNNGITNLLEAWLAFLCEDDPDIILSLIQAYPQFKPMYEQIYEICLNMEEIMGLFSKELQILDRNTVRFMIDEMQDELNSLKQEKAALLQEIDSQIQQKKNLLQEIDSQIQEKDSQIQEKDSQIQEKDSQIQEKDSQIQEKDSQIQEKDSQIQEKEELLQEKNRLIQELQAQLNAAHKR